MKKNTVKKLYADLGKKYYELYRSDPAEPLKQTCEEITVALEAIEKKRHEIDEIKSSAQQNEPETEQKAAAEPEPAEDDEAAGGD